MTGQAGALMSSKVVFVICVICVICGLFAVFEGAMP